MNALLTPPNDVLIEEDKGDIFHYGLHAFVEKAWPIIEPATPYIDNWHIGVICEQLEAVWKCQINDLLINMPPRHMKGCAYSQPIYTPLGWRTHGALSVGDEVFTPDGTVARITHKSYPFVCNLRVTFSNGDAIDVNGDHLWTVYNRSCAKWETRDTASLQRLRLFSGNRCVFQLPAVQPLQFAKQVLPIHPYFLGCWLGDGTSSGPCITHDQDEIDHILAIRSRCGMHVTIQHKHPDVLSRSVRSEFRHQHVTKLLKDYDLFNHKHIPRQYLQSSIAQRMQLLAGLIDTDGSCEQTTGRIRLATSDIQLREDYMELLIGLGQRPYLVESVTPAYGQYAGGKSHWQVCFQPTVDIPCALERKRPQRLASQRAIGIVSIETLHPTQAEQGNCITIDRPDGLYLVGRSCIPTHNSITVAVMFPAYVWAFEPSLRWLYSSYAQSLSIRDSIKMRRLIESPWYQARWGDKYQLTSDQNQKIKFENDKTGYRMAT